MKNISFAGHRLFQIAFYIQKPIFKRNGQIFQSRGYSVKEAIGPITLTQTPKHTSSLYLYVHSPVKSDEADVMISLSFIVLWVGDGCSSTKVLGVGAVVRVRGVVFSKTYYRSLPECIFFFFLYERNTCKFLNDFQMIRDALNDKSPINTGAVNLQMYKACKSGAGLTSRSSGRP